MRGQAVGTGVLALALALGTAATACAGSDHVTHVRSAPSARSSQPATARPAKVVRQRPPFRSAVSRVTARQLGKSWHHGCPVRPSRLRAVHLSYVDFHGRPHTGELIVNKDVVSPIVRVFRRLYRHQFPIRRMVPVSVYGADDNRSAAADNTSAFNCRNAVASGPPHWSMHAYGLAVDVNDVENPYVDGNRIIPKAGRHYLNRDNVRPGMAEPNKVLVRAFTSIGWGWGGAWTGAVDYQHFSSNGH